MSIPLVVTGQVFNYPVNFDVNWGIDATGWAQAVTNGMLQKTGGTFAISSDVDFGSSFGLKAAYFETRSLNPATTGTFRLASADPASIAFRNNANSGNLILTTDASDNLLYNGSIIAPSVGGPISVARGGTGDTSLLAYSVLCGGTTSTNPVQSVSSVGLVGQALVSNGAGLLPTWQNVSGSGTVNSGTGGTIAYYASTGTTISALTALTVSSPVLTWSVPSAQSTIQILCPGANVASLNMSANGLTNVMNLGSTGSIILQDLDNNRRWLEYDRAAGGLVSMVTPLAMSANKITGLANGLATTDATAFGQVQYGFQNAVQSTDTSQHNSNTPTYSATNLFANITPTSSSSRIKITVTGNSVLSPGSGVSAVVTLFRGISLGTPIDIAPNSGGFAVVTSSVAGGNAISCPISITYIDSPATTGVCLYQVYIKSSSSATVTWNVSSAINTIILEELR